MLFFKKKKIQQKKSFQWKIKKKCLDLILESAKSSYPKEFGALLRVDSKDKFTINELVLLPGTISGDSHAIFRLHMLPVDFSIVGTIHSHPSPLPYPSEADLALFRKHGKVHIITAKPYDYASWKAYDYEGKKIDIKVI
jgi:proteasome lid subunit RPN8/RPN11